jgi:GT2 family glycosyltransferase
VNKRISVLVVIVTTNDGCWLGSCLESLRSSQYSDFEVAVVFNTCTDDSAQICADSDIPIRIFKSPRRLGFAAANNLVIAEAEERGYRYIYLLNPDTRVHCGAIGALVECLEACQDYGVLGSWQAEYDDATWSQPNEWSRETLNEAQNLGSQPHRVGPFTILDHYYVQGAALMMRVSLIPRIGMLDRFYGTFYEETDLCRRALLAGCKVGLLFDSKVRHFGGGNWQRSRKAQEERDRLFLRNQFYYLLSAPDALENSVGAGWKIVRDQIGDLFSGRRHFVLPLWRYPLVLASILRNLGYLYELRARNLAIREGRRLDPAQWSIGPRQWN